MNVRDLNDAARLSEALKSGALIQVSGWLVVIDAELFLLDENLVDPYVDSEKLKISDPFIAYSVRDVISPLGVGKASYFIRQEQ